MSHTHTGYVPETGYMLGHDHGHRDNRGRVHALTGPATPYQGAAYRAICGKAVRCDEDMAHGRLSVQAGTVGVTCRRCRKIVGN